jgi:cytoskeletal protein CcmA (bactofilin family)
MKRAALLIAILAALVTAAPAHAGDDQIVITGDVVVERGQTLDDVIVVNGHVRVLGRVTGDLIAVSAPIRLNGPVEGDVVALSDPIVIGPGGRVEGDLRYADEEPVITVPGAVQGDTEKLDFGDVSGPFRVFAARLALWLAMTVSSLLLGLALLWLAPRALEAALEMARTSTGPAIAMGLGVFFGLPAVAVILFITLVGIPLSIAVLLALLPIYAIGYSTTAWLLGRAIVRPPTGRVPAFLAGWGIMRALALIPVVGGITWFGATVFGLGALALALWRSRRGPVTTAPLTA